MSECKKPTPSQQEWLQRDIAEYHRIFSQTPGILDRVADVRDLGEQNYVAVTLDLAWRVFDYAIAVSLLLKEELRDAVFPIQRSMFESLATLGYLTKHENSRFEALVFRAFSFEKENRLFPHEEEIVAGNKQTLARMPPEVVAEAIRRLETGRKNWSTLSIKKMAERASVVGYETLYDHLSSEAHANVVGSRVRATQGDDGFMEVKLGAEFSDRDRESNANFARRALKHAMLMAFVGLKPPALRIESVDPDTWS